jgi:hypothetical protein
LVVPLIHAARERAAAWDGVSPVVGMVAFKTTESDEPKDVVAFCLYPDSAALFEVLVDATKTVFPL